MSEPAPFVSDAHERRAANLYARDMRGERAGTVTPWAGLPDEGKAIWRRAVKP